MFRRDARPVRLFKYRIASKINLAMIQILEYSDPALDAGWSSR